MEDNERGSFFRWSWLIFLSKNIRIKVSLYVQFLRGPRQWWKILERNDGQVGQFVAPVSLIGTLYFLYFLEKNNLCNVI